MTIKLDYERLTVAARAAEALAGDIRANAAIARASSPIPLPSLEGIEEKATALDEYAAELYELADLALLLDESGEGSVSMPLTAVREMLNDLLGEYLGAEFANFFGNDDDFPLISLGFGAGKMWRMAHGVAPIFQTGLIVRLPLTQLAKVPGQSGAWARWMLAGPRHAPLPTGLLKTPGWVTAAGSRMPNAGWASPLNSQAHGLGAMRGLGIVGGVVSTGAGVKNLYDQGNPVDAFKREGAGYVADVAGTAFSASTTAFLVAPNPVTGAVAVASGVVWAGAEVVDHWDDIAEGASKAWDKVSFWD